MKNHSKIYKKNTFFNWLNISLIIYSIFITCIFVYSLSRYHRLWLLTNDIKLERDHFEKQGVSYAKDYLDCMRPKIKEVYFNNTKEIPVTTPTPSKYDLEKKKYLDQFYVKRKQR